MRLQIASDLHLELGKGDVLPLTPAPDADLLVLAGDIHGGTRGIEAFADWPVPVVYVPGNHEFYNQHHNRVLVELPKAAAERGGRITVLDMDEVRFPGVRILGCTLWTDFELFRGRRIAAQMASSQRIADFGCIRTDNGRLTPVMTVNFFRVARAWLTARLAEPFDGKTVVVTHHAPSLKSIAPKYAKDVLSPAFASRLDDLVDQADLWIHGHVHHSCDYRVSRGRVICNPRGYPASQFGAGDLNPEWNPQLVLEV
jgi:predicted phosphodiesterase